MSAAPGLLFCDHGVLACVALVWFVSGRVRAGVVLQPCVSNTYASTSAHVSKGDNVCASKNVAVTESDPVCVSV